jgi:hypothetical protein
LNLLIVRGCGIKEGLSAEGKVYRWAEIGEANGHVMREESARRQASGAVHTGRESAAVEQTVVENQLRT